jgi:hypothetical protein
LFFVALINFVGVGFGTMQTPYLLSRTGNSETTLGVLLMIGNIGAVAGGNLGGKHVGGCPVGGSSSPG